MSKIWYDLNRLKGVKQQYLAVKRKGFFFFNRQKYNQAGFLFSWAVGWDAIIRSGQPSPQPEKEDATADHGLPIAR